MSSEYNHAKRSHRSEALKRSAFGSMERHATIQRYKTEQKKSVGERLAKFIKRVARGREEK